MIEQLGPATLFVTFSAADLHWPEFNRLFDDGTPLQNEHLENRRRQKLLNENPHLAAMFFELRWKYFVEHVLKKVFPIKVRIIFLT